MNGKDAFIEKYQHMIDGWILDACISQRTGADLSLWLKRHRANVTLQLGLIYDELKPESLPTKTQANGVKR